MAALGSLLRQLSAPRHHAIGLFGPKGVKERLFLRVSDLLDAAVGINNGLSQYVCEKCEQKLDRCLSKVHKRQIDPHSSFYIHVHEY